MLESSRHANSFRELIVYQTTKEMARKVFKLSQRFPKEETYALTDQLRRSSRSIGAQIAEAWGKRRYERHFISKLTDADAEQNETQHWIDTAFDCNYLSPQHHAQLLEQLRSIGRMLNSMIAKANTFCGPIDNG